jgi:hypothetical protein
MNLKPSVMLVMGDAKLRGILVSRFLREGWKADGTDDIREAERKAVRFRPKVFATELFGSETSIKKLVKHLRSLPTLHTAKLVILLKHPPRALVDEAYAAGADGVMLWGSLAPREAVKTFAKLLIV